MLKDHENGAHKLSQKLARFTVSFTLNAAPDRVLDNAKLAILDCLGVAVLATAQEIGENLLKFASANASLGPCTIWGTNKTASPRDAAFINGSLAHGLDYDDRNHSTTYTLAASLAVAEQMDLSGAKMLAAFIVGREVRNSLDALFGHRSAGIGPGAKGWHSNGILGPIAAACSASHAMSLSARETLAAIGLAAGSCGALTRDGGTMAKPFRTGHAAVTGLTCALLAQSGFTSDDTAIEGRYGLLEALGPLPEDLVASLARDLGIKFHLENENRIKPYASCTATHNGLEAMLRLARRHDIKPESVESIECDQKPYPLVRQIPQRGYEGRFSMAYCLAMALVHRDLKPGDFIDENVRDRRVQDLMTRLRHTPDGPSLIVKLKDGSRLEEKLRTPSDLHGWDEVAKKFKAVTQGIIGSSQSAASVDQVRKLESLASICPLTQALKPAAIKSGIGSPMIFLVLCVVFTLLGYSPAWAAAAPAKIRLSQSNVGVSALPLWIANHYGFFKKYGIELEPIYVRNAPIQIMALTTGEVQLSHTGGAPTLNAAATGHNLKIVATFTHGAYWDIVGRPELKSMEDLRGKEVGVTNLGGTFWIGAILSLEHFRLNPERDRIKLQALGDQTVLSQALSSGRIDAILTEPAFTRELKRKGFRVIAEMSRAKLPFASSCLVVSQAYLQQQPEVVEGVLKGLIEATAFVYNPANQDIVLRFFSERLKFSDPAAAKEALQDIDIILARKPYPGLEGLRNIQRVLRSNPNVAKLKPEDLIDERIYRRIEDSGFIDSVYRFARNK